MSHTELSKASQIIVSLKKRMLFLLMMLKPGEILNVSRFILINISQLVLQEHRSWSSIMEKPHQEDLEVQKNKNMEQLLPSIFQ